MKSLFALLLAALLPLVAAAAPAAPAPVAGEDYVQIEGGQPWQPAADKVEIVEVFGYWCPHCNEFQPRLAAWQRTLPGYVRLTYLPAVFADGDAFARAYFAALDAGALPRLHDALYRAVHVDGVLARNATVDELAWFFGQHGLDAARMRTAMLSPATEARLRAAREFALRSGVEGTPSLVVGGRYRVTAKTHEDGLRIARALAAQLHGGG